VTVREFSVRLWPHQSTTTVTVVVIDTSGARRVSGGVGKITLPVGIEDFSGEPVGAVLMALSEALGALGSSLPPKGGPASPGGPQGRSTVPGQLPLQLDITSTTRGIAEGE
jgi:hypothetical protein